MQSKVAQTIFNHLTHGGCADSLFIPGDDPAEFETLVDTYFESHRPATDDHAAIVFDFAHARWMLWRRQRAQGATEYAVYSCGAHPGDWDDNTYRKLANADRYFTRAQRAFQRALANLRCVKKDEENSLRWRAQHALAKQRVQIAIEKHELYLSLKKPKPEPPSDTSKEYAPVYKEEDGDETFIEQKFYVTNNTITQVTPSNAEVRSILALRKQYPVPPTYIVRCYQFDGPFPKQGFDFLIDDPEQRDILHAHINHPLSFDEWRSLAALEDQNHLHPTR